MMDLEYKQQLARKIEDAFYAKKLTETPEWKLIAEACQVAAKDATYRLIHDKLTDPVEIARFQERIKIYGGFLSGVVSFLKYGGDEAIKEANENDMSLDDIF